MGNGGAASCDGEVARLCARTAVECSRMTGVTRVKCGRADEGSRRRRGGVEQVVVTSCG